MKTLPQRRAPRPLVEQQARHPHLKYRRKLKALSLDIATPRRATSVVRAGG